MPEDILIRTVADPPITNKPDGLGVTMELEDHPVRIFMPKYNRYEPKIRDSTSIKSWKTCQRKYFYEIVLGFSSRETPPYFAWGSAYHKFREVLEVAYGFGHGKPEKFDDTKAAEAYVAATQAGLAYWKKHGREQPQDPKNKYAFMTTERLLKSFIEAFKHWSLEKKQGRIEVIAVEQAFNVQLSDGSSTSGRADQIVRWNGRLWGRDWKTTSKDTAFYTRQLEPNDQFTRYTLAEGKLSGEQIQGQFVEVLYNANATKNDTKGPKIIEFTTSRTPQQLAIFEREQIFINKQLELNRMYDIWPMHEPACPFCPFHSVCSRPTEAGMMAQLEQHFKIAPWDNTRVDERNAE